MGRYGGAVGTCPWVFGWFTIIWKPFPLFILSFFLVLILIWHLHLPFSRFPTHIWIPSNLFLFVSTSQHTSLFHTFWQLGSRYRSVFYYLHCTTPLPPPLSPPSREKQKKVQHHYLTVAVSIVTRLKHWSVCTLSFCFREFSSFINGSD